MTKTMFAVLTVGACLAGVPAFAATTTPAPVPRTSGMATVNPVANAPSQRNPLLADNGDVRMSKLIGTDVYNQQDKKIGSVDDVLAGTNGRPDVILKVNGKLVQVPWDKLQFGNAQQNSDNKVIMSGETQSALAGQPTFHYHTNSRG